MHESSLGRDLVRIVLARVPAGARVLAVRGRLSETEAISPFAVEFHFRAAAVGTPLDHAQLTLRVEHVSARCLDCGALYLPEHHLTLCGACGSSRGEILGETGLWVDEVDVVDGVGG